MKRSSRRDADRRVDPSVITQGPWVLILKTDAAVIRNGLATFGSVEEFAFPSSHRANLVEALRRAKGSRIVKAWFAADGVMPVEELWTFEFGPTAVLRRIFMPEYETSPRPDNFLLKYWELPSLLRTFKKIPDADPTGGHDDRAKRLPVAPSTAHLGARRLVVAPSVREWEVALRQADLDGRSCPLSGDRPGVPLGRFEFVLELPRGAAALHRHNLTAVPRHHRSGWHLTGIAWPSTLSPGVVVTITWDRGNRRAVARTSLLPRPVIIDGIEYRYQYDVQTVTRELRSIAERDSPPGRLSDRGWATNALRRLGHLFDDGSVMLAEAALASACVTLGMPAVQAKERVHRAVGLLIDEGIVKRLGGSTDAAGQPHYPPRPGQVTVQLLRYRPVVKPMQDPASDRAEESAAAGRRTHHVTGFVRRLPADATASPEQRQLHEDEIRAARVVDRPLNPGYTFVRSHQRNRPRPDH